jgi:hypothetical protein
MNTTTKRWADLGERAAWTLLQAGFGIELVELSGMPEWAAVPIAGALAAVKSYLASQFGNGSAATVPQSVERY